MIFYWENMNSVKFVRNVFDDFVGLSKLITNMEKSHVYLSGIDDEF